ncbi:MAG: hypothetical protein CMJ75_21820 [Planctomycetaceae bacterium]|nr:hypothetical protein [Planctomycetaceae bacterium]
MIGGEHCSNANLVEWVVDCALVNHLDDDFTAGGSAAFQVDVALRKFECLGEKGYNGLLRVSFFGIRWQLHLDWLHRHFK